MYRSGDLADLMLIFESCADAAALHRDTILVRKARLHGRNFSHDRVQGLNEFRGDLCLSQFQHCMLSADTD